ncbi:MAG TPA: hypothetical protein VMU66_05440 [Gaiellales bacterium]|nr:hypothetical protein [Gaiellales bacterium]
MSLVVHLPEELARRVEAAAAARGVPAEQVALEAIDAQLDTHLGVSAASGRRRLAFASIGASGSARGAAEADELLAQGFGRD